MTQTQLTNGKIPVGTVCPFTTRCEMAQGGLCKHKGVEHNVEFSCAISRAFDLIDRRGSADHN